MHKKLILITACLSVFFEALDVSAVNLAMVFIQKDIPGAVDSFEWVQSIYILFYGGFLLLGGKLADINGRKKIYLLGSGIFLIASIFVMLSGSMPLLLIGRAMQGLGAALAIPSAIAIISNLYDSPSERQHALGIFGAFAAIGFASGLVFGGLTASLLGWKWIFGLNIIVIAPVLLFAARVVPSDKRNTDQIKTDIPGAVLLTLFLLVFTFAIHAFGASSQRRFFLPALALIIVLAIICYCLHKARKDVLMPILIFEKQTIITAVIPGILLGASFMSYISILSVYLQHALQMPLIQTGIFLFPFSIISALVSKYWLPWLQRRYSLRFTGGIGFSVLLLGNLALALCAWNYHIVLLVLSVLCVNGVSMAVAYPTITSLALQGFHQKDHGMAAGLQSTAYSSGCGIGIAFTWAIMRWKYSEAAQFSTGAFIGGATICAVISLAAIIAIACLSKPVKAVFLR